MLDVQAATAGLPESLIGCTPENRQVSGKKRLAKSGWLKRRLSLVDPSG